MRSDLSLPDASPVIPALWSDMPPGIGRASVLLALLSSLGKEVWSEASLSMDFREPVTSEIWPQGFIWEARPGEALASLPEELFAVRGDLKDVVPGWRFLMVAGWDC